MLGLPKIRYFHVLLQSFNQITPESFNFIFLILITGYSRGKNGSRSGSKATVDCWGPNWSRSPFCTNRRTEITLHLTDNQGKRLPILLLEWKNELCYSGCLETQLALLQANECNSLGEWWVGQGQSCKSFIFNDYVQYSVCCVVV